MQLQFNTDLDILIIPGDYERLRCTAYVILITDPSLSTTIKGSKECCLTSDLGAWIVCMRAWIVCMARLYAYKRLAIVENAV